MRLFCRVIFGVGFLFCVSMKAENAKTVTAPVSTTNQNEKPAKKSDPAEEMASAVLEGFKCEQKGDFPGAISAYTKALSAQDDSPVALIRRGIVYARMGKKAEALLDLRRATSPRTYPHTVTDFATLGWLRATSPLIEFRDGALAVSYGDKAVSYTDSAENYDVLAAGYAEMGNFQKARDTLMEGLKYFPNSERAKGMKERLKLYENHKKFRDDWWPDGVE